MMKAQSIIWFICIELYFQSAFGEKKPRELINCHEAMNSKPNSTQTPHSQSKALNGRKSQPTRIRIGWNNSENISENPMP